MNIFFNFIKYTEIIHIYNLPHDRLMAVLEMEGGMKLLWVFHFRQQLQSYIGLLII